jgi:LmbE family N-acetylglucosaminyl deacetylase
LKNKKLNILAIGAHPDDIELGCGGSLLKAARDGANIFMYIVTRGSSAGSVVKRSNEIINSAKYIGARSLWIDNYEDAAVYLSKELINSIEFFIRKTNADLIYTHPLKDNHHDHRAVAEATVEAGRFTPNILAYENPSTKNFLPVVFSDISSVIYEKVKLIDLYGSQKSKLFLSSNSVKGLAEYRAFQTRFDPNVTHVEAFEAIKLLIDVDYSLLPTRRPVEDLKPSQNIIEFHV